MKADPRSRNAPSHDNYGGRTARVASIGSALNRTRDIAPGVPMLRHILALLALVSGAIEVNARFATIRQSVLGIVILAAPTMLLAVTGFLFARSAESRSGRTLVSRYAGRLLPALIVSLLVTITALGLLVSNLSRRRYFGAAETWRYLANAGGWSSITLPGVFEFNNASSTVNAMLWIVPVMGLGGALAALAAFAPSTVRRGLFVGGCAAVFGWGVAIGIGSVDQYDLPRGLRPLADPQVVAGAAGQFLGMLAYVFRHRVPARPLLCVLAGIMVGGAAVFPRLWLDDAIAQIILAVPLAYLAVMLAVAWLPTPWPLDRVNYSVGIVLYAYPVEQACLALRGTAQSIFVTLLLGIPATTVLAMVSWHVIERPLIAWRRAQPVLTVDRGSSRASSRPARWYLTRASAAIPAVMMIVAFSAVMLALAAVAMFAVQRDQPGM